MIKPNHILIIMVFTYAIQTRDLSGDKQGR